MSNDHLNPPPWYKQGWPWALISVPFLTVVACAFTIYLAISSDDGLVTGDYYKDGLAINQNLDKQQQAEQLGLSAQMLLLPEISQVQVAVAEWSSEAPLTLRLTHATHQSADTVVELARASNGAYKAELDLQGKQGKWYVDLRPTDNAWRLRGQLQLPGSQSIGLAP